MTVNAINGTLLSAFSAVDGVSLSTLSAINGQALAGGGGTPNPSDLLILANADIDSGGEFWSGSGLNLLGDTSWGVSRVYATPTALMGLGTSLSLPTVGGEEFLSVTLRFVTTIDATGSIVTFRRVSASATHVSFNYVAGGTLRVGNGTGAADVDSAAGLMSINTVYRLNVYVRCHDTLGEWEVTLFSDSGTVLYTASASGIDTHNAGNLMEIIAIGNPAGDQQTDSVAVDLTGAYRGFGHVETLTPAGVGDLTQWTRAGGDKGANWRQLTEHPKNASASIVSTAADQYDFYPFDPIATSGQPIGAQQIIYARALTAGTREFKAACRIGGVTYDHATTHSTTDTAADFPFLANWENDPSTGSAWANNAAINAAQFGVKSVTTDLQIQSIVLQVLTEPDGSANISNEYFKCGFEGADGATTAAEDHGHALTFNGTAQIDTGQFAVGAASLELDGNSDYVTVPFSYAFDLGSRDFFIEARVRFRTITGNHVILSCYNNSGNQRGWYLRRTTGNLLEFTWSTTGSNTVVVDEAWTPSTDTWYKVRAQRSGQLVSLWVDDSMLGSATLNHDHVFAPTEGLLIGAVQSSGIVQFVDGWIDEVIIRKGGVQ